QEGVRISPIRLFSADGPDEEKIDLILSNLRSRDERRGDLFAQFAADDVAARRLGELVERYGADTLGACFEALHAASEAAMRAAIRALPDGVFTGEDWLDDDGVDARPLPIRVRVEIGGDEATSDFTGAVAPALPARVPASGPTASGVRSFGARTRDGRGTIFYEAHGGGDGAGVARDGGCALRVDMSNVMNTPTEVVGAEYPLRVEEHAL